VVTAAGGAGRGRQETQAVVAGRWQDPGRTQAEAGRQNSRTQNPDPGRQEPRNLKLNPGGAAVVATHNGVTRTGSRTRTQQDPGGRNQNGRQAGPNPETGRWQQ